MGFVIVAALLLIGVFLFAVAIEGFIHGDTVDRMLNVGKAMTQ